MLCRCVNKCTTHLVMTEIIIITSIQASIIILLHSHSTVILPLFYLLNSLLNHFMILFTTPCLYFLYSIDKFLRRQPLSNYLSEKGIPCLAQLFPLIRLNKSFFLAMRHCRSSLVAYNRVKNPLHKQV